MTVQRRICVADRGVGLEPQALKHLFQPFFTQFDPSRHSSGDFGFQQARARSGPEHQQAVRRDARTARSRPRVSRKKARGSQFACRAAASLPTEDAPRVNRGSGARTRRRRPSVHRRNPALLRPACPESVSWTRCTFSRRTSDAHSADRRRRTRSQQASGNAPPTCGATRSSPLSPARKLWNSLRNRRRISSFWT